MDIKDKFKSYKSNYKNAKDWFETNFDKIKQLFEDKKLRDFIFEPFMSPAMLKYTTNAK